jgi:hypothetical protein
VDDLENESGFLLRWSRRKAKARGLPATPVPAGLQPVDKLTMEVAPSATPSPGAVPIDARSSEAPPTLADAARLTRESDFTRFVANGVQADVKSAALKRLFSDPHFNLMDGLDVYIDDYSRPDPLPPGMLLKIAQAGCLGLLTQEPEEQTACRPEAGNHGTIEPGPASAGVDAQPAEKIASNENLDLQLQPHDAAGRAGVKPGPGKDGGHEH